MRASLRAAPPREAIGAERAAAPEMAAAMAACRANAALLTT